MTVVPLWSTASFGETTETTPIELAALREHLAACRTGWGRLVALHCAARRAQGFVACRLMTSVLLVAGLVGLLGRLT